MAAGVLSVGYLFVDISPLEMGGKQQQQQERGRLFKAPESRAGLFHVESVTA